MSLNKVLGFTGRKPIRNETKEKQKMYSKKFHLFINRLENLSDVIGAF